MEFHTMSGTIPKPPPETGAFGKERSIAIPIVRGRKRLPDEAGTLEKFPIIQKRGKVSTFFIHTKYRQNATWQGDIFRVEEEACFPFKSVLRMLQIMDRGNEKGSGGKMHKRAAFFGKLTVLPLFLFVLFFAFALSSCGKKSTGKIQGRGNPFGGLTRGQCALFLP